MLMSYKKTEKKILCYFTGKKLNQKWLIDFSKKSLAFSLRHLSLNNLACNSIQLIANLFAEQILLEYEDSDSAHPAHCSILLN